MQNILYEYSYNRRLNCRVMHCMIELYIIYSNNIVIYDLGNCIHVLQISHYNNCSFNNLY